MSRQCGLTMRAKAFGWHRLTVGSPLKNNVTLFLIFLSRKTALMFDRSTQALFHVIPGDGLHSSCIPENRRDNNRPGDIFCQRIPAGEMGGTGVSAKDTRSKLSKMFSIEID